MEKGLQRIEEMYQQSEPA
jgi:hypothetical protein